MRKIKRMIKLINSLEGLTEEEKKSIIKRMILELIFNSWRLPLKWLCFIFFAIFITIGTIFEKLTELFSGILATIFQELGEKIDNLCLIQFSTKEEREKLIKLIRKQDRYKKNKNF